MQFEYSRIGVYFSTWQHTVHVYSCLLVFIPSHTPETYLSRDVLVVSMLSQSDGASEERFCTISSGACFVMIHGVCCSTRVFARDRSRRDCCLFLVSSGIPRLSGDLISEASRAPGSVAVVVSSSSSSVALCLHPVPVLRAPYMFSPFLDLPALCLACWLRSLFR